MARTQQLAAVGAVFILTSMAWLVLGGVTEMRRGQQARVLGDSVEDLWGTPQTQAAPNLRFEWEEKKQVTRTETEDGKNRQISELIVERQEQSVPLASSDIDVQLHSDLRRKGLLWYSLYDVDFDGTWTYRHEQLQSGHLLVRFAFPGTQGIYDNLVFEVDGVDFLGRLDPSAGQITARIAVEPGQQVNIHAGYRSRGKDEWRYAPSQGVTGVGRLTDFTLRAHTDFGDIDFPSRTLSPSEKTADGEGWNLLWRFDQVATGQGIGIVTPTRIQPGELASRLSISAPISLAFFFLVLMMFASLRGIDLRPLNYALLAGAFFAFHLLFAYSVDHMSVPVAFALSSVVSMLLVITYLRLVVSERFAWREAGIAQLVYLIGFSLAHFLDGYAGLTVTVLSIATLFLMMQLTGRMQTRQNPVNSGD